VYAGAQSLEPASLTPCVPNPRSDTTPQPNTHGSTPDALLRAGYRVLAELGRGGMGVVYRVEEVASGRELALKMILDGSSDPRRKERFLREGQVVASLRHTGIVRVHSCGEAGGLPYLTYDLVTGSRPFNEVLEDRPLAEGLALVRDVARALGHAHACGVVHRDVKPENLLVDDTGWVRVADFGLAAGLGLDRLTRTGELLGTPSFMPPEQFSGDKRQATPASDVWSMGVVLYELLTGALPFEADTLVELSVRIVNGSFDRPGRVRPELPAALEAICLRCLELEPTDRYADGSALADDLDMYLAGGEEPLGGGSRSSGQRVLLVAALGVLVLGGLGAWASAVRTSDVPDSGVAAGEETSQAEARDPALAKVREALAARRFQAALDALPRNAPGLLRCEVYVATGKWRLLAELLGETDDPGARALAHLHLGRRALRDDPKKAREHLAKTDPLGGHPLRATIAQEARDRALAALTELRAMSALRAGTDQAQERRAEHCRDMANAWIVAKNFGVAPTENDLDELFTVFSLGAGALTLDDQYLLQGLDSNRGSFLSSYCYKALRDEIPKPERDLPLFRRWTKLATESNSAATLPHTSYASALLITKRAEELGAFAALVQETHSQRPRMVATVLTYHGTLLVDLSRYTEAAGPLDRALALNPRNFDAVHARLRLAHGLLLKGELPSTEQGRRDGWAWLEGEDGRKPSKKRERQEALRSLARLELEAGEPRRCLDLLDQLLVANPRETGEAVWRVQVLVTHARDQRDRLEAALTAVETSIVARSTMDLEYSRSHGTGSEAEIASHYRLVALAKQRVPYLVELLAEGDFDGLLANLKELRSHFPW
jgi:tetratricopeptide (TPR) repeat protein